MGILNFYFLGGAILVCAFGRYWGSKIALLTNLILLSGSFLITTVLVYESIFGAVTEVLVWNWFNTLRINSDITFYYDFLSTTMIWLVLTISFLVHIFSYSYMENDPMKIRFFFFLSLFTFFMCFLVVSSSFLQFFFAWEGVGLTSYLLINFWYTRIEANRAALKALIINRFGDFGLYTGLIIIFVLLNSCSIPFSNASTLIYIFMPAAEVHFEDIICLFLFIGVVGKSAQLGLHTWLPDAMEGPTPVSALLHAATMVTAGVFLLLRLAEFFTISNIMMWIAFWGALSAFFASTIGVFQYDIKKIIAYSTCSQLGYMVAACGMLNFSGAFFHLFNHAFFKALLFLGAGSVIHALSDDQDLRKYGALINFVPLTAITMLIASLSLAGAPFLSGFYSKDIIINWGLISNEFLVLITYWLLVLSAFLTAYYSIKILYMAFWSEPRFNHTSLKIIHEGNLFMKVPLMILSVLSVTTGYFFCDIFVGRGVPSRIAVFFLMDYGFELEYLISQTKKFLPLIFVLLSIPIFLINKKYFFHFTYYGSFYPVFLRFMYITQVFFTKKWYFDYFYYYIAHCVMWLSYEVFFKNFDKGILEKTFIKEVVWGLVRISNVIRFIATGDITQYLLITFTVTCLLMILFFFQFLESAFLLFIFSFVVIILILSSDSTEQWEE